MSSNESETQLIFSTGSAGSEALPKQNKNIRTFGFSTVMTRCARYPMAIRTPVTYSKHPRLCRQHNRRPDRTTRWADSDSIHYPSTARPSPSAGWRCNTQLIVDTCTWSSTVVISAACQRTTWDEHSGNDWAMQSIIQQFSGSVCCTCMLFIAHDRTDGKQRQ